MKTKSISLFLALMLAPLLYHSQTTALDWLYDHSDLVVACKVVSDIDFSFDELGMLNCICTVEMTEVFKGKLQPPQRLVFSCTIDASSQSDAASELTKGTDCILFLKGPYKSVPAWALADRHFGVHRATVAMAKELRSMQKEHTPSSRE